MMDNNKNEINNNNNNNTIDSLHLLLSLPPVKHYNPTINNTYYSTSIKTSKKNY